MQCEWILHFNNSAMTRRFCLWLYESFGHCLHPQIRIQILFLKMFCLGPQAYFSWCYSSLPQGLEDHWKGCFTNLYMSKTTYLLKLHDIWALVPNLQQKNVKPICPCYLTGFSARRQPLSCSGESWCKSHCLAHSSFKLCCWNWENNQC